MTIKCFYHGADLDGWASAAIVRHYWSEYEETPIEMYPINYGDKFPMEGIEKQDIVYMVDFSLPLEEMRELNSRCELTWIDHHIGVINDPQFLEIWSQISGVMDSRFSACELAWMYFYEEEEIPRFIKLLGLYDRWEHNDPIEPWDVIEAFQYGFKVSAKNPKEDDFSFWENQFFDIDGVRIENKISLGYKIQTYVEDRFQSSLSERSFIVDWEGYKCLVINGDPYVANYFTRAREFEGCDIGINFCNSKGKFWTVNLRTARDDIDLSSLAKKYGGGGHRAAAGFTCKELPFGVIQ